MRNIKNVLVAAVTLGLVGITLPSFAQELDLDKLDKQVKAASVRIVADGGQGAICSGTVVSSKRDEKTGNVKTIILTAQHCVSDKPYRNFNIEFPRYSKEGVVVSRDTYVAEIAKQGSDTNDLALLVLKDNTTSFAERAASVAAKGVMPRFGERVFTSGYAFGMGLGVTEGRFNSAEEINFPDENKDTKFFRASPSVAPGNSGGGLFHLTSTGDFELIGVTDWIAGKPPSTFGAYTPIERVSEFLVSYDSGAFKQ